MNLSLPFICAGLSFHVYSGTVSCLADNSVAKPPPCAKEGEDKVRFRNVVGKAGQSAFGIEERVGRPVWKRD